MSFLNSIFFGVSGKYDINGISVKFEDDHVEVPLENSWLGHIANTVLRNSAVQFLTLGYLHVFIHEMGHAFAAQLYGDKTSVSVFTKPCQGLTTSLDDTGHTNIENKFIALAGPLAGVAFEITKLVAAVAAVVLFPQVVGLPVGILLGTGAVFWILGELMYALSGKGDWDIITG